MCDKADCTHPGKGARQMIYHWGSWVDPKEGNNTIWKCTKFSIYVYVIMYSKLNIVTAQAKELKGKTGIIVSFKNK